jgi:hypothetical protein
MKRVWQNGKLFLFLFKTLSPRHCSAFCSPSLIDQKSNKTHSGRPAKEKRSYTIKSEKTIHKKLHP